MRYQIKAASLLLAATLPLAACGAGGGSGQTNLVIGGSTSGSTGYAYTVAITNVINENVPGVQVQVQETAGTIDGVNQVLDGDLDLAVSTGDTTRQALDGVGPFESRGPSASLRQFINLYATPYNLIVGEKSSIRQPADLKGQTIGAGDAGSGSAQLLVDLLETQGLSDEEARFEYLAPADQGDAFQDNRLDAMSFLGGLGTGWVQELSRSQDLRWIPISEETLDGLQPEGGAVYTSYTIPGGTYNKQPDDVETFASVVQLVASDELSPEIAQKISDAFWENKADIENALALAKETTPESAYDPEIAPITKGSTPPDSQ